MLLYLKTIFDFIIILYKLNLFTKVFILSFIPYYILVIVI